MDDIDQMLRRLADAPVPPLLYGIDQDVLAQIAAPPKGRPSIGLSAMTAAMAVTMGVASHGLAPPPAHAKTPLPLFGLDTPLAPSTLLSGIR